MDNVDPVDGLGLRIAPHGNGKKSADKKPTMEFSLVETEGADEEAALVVVSAPALSAGAG